MHLDKHMSIRQPQNLLADTLSFIAKHKCKCIRHCNFTKCRGIVQRSRKNSVTLLLQTHQHSLHITSNHRNVKQGSLCGTYHLFIVYITAVCR